MEEAVKAGLRGMGYVRTNPAAAWPAWLAVKLPNG
jgi:HlyD family secretion protein